MKKIVVLTGAGVSKESGIKTFRESDGLWEEYRIEDVATFDAWENDPKLVLEFYNQRRKQLLEVQPNPAHYALVELEKKFDVQIITQNVDDLHERAGSKKVLHLHGELKKSRSSIDSSMIYPIEGWELKWGDLCEKGSQLRPHIVWFGEPVPMIAEASRLTMQTNIFIIIGTSLNVYPAAGLVHYVKPHIKKYLVDPNDCKSEGISNLTIIKKEAGTGVPALVEKLLNEGL